MTAAKPSPRVIVVDTSAEIEAISRALLLLDKHSGLLAPAPGGWLILPKSAGLWTWGRDTATEVRSP